jgi:hypothetical protein
VIERVAPADRALFRREESGHPVGLVAIVACEGPAPPLEKVRDRVGRLLPSVPRFRAVPQAVPLDIERPVWVDDERFSVIDHVRVEAFAPPAGRDVVEALAEELARRRFEATRPRWDMLLVPDGDRWLLAAHLHLALIDELRSTDLFSCVLVPRVTPEPQPRYEAAPNPGRLLLDSLRDLLTNPYEQVRFVSSAMRRVRPETPPPPPVHAQQRRVVVELDDLRSVRAAHGGSVNDALATVVMRAAGEATGRSELTLLLPFAVRSLSRPGYYDNQIEAVTVELATRGPDPARHHREVSARLDRVARDNLAVGGRLLGRVAATSPFVLLALGARACVGASADVVLVNGPGPKEGGKVFTGHSVDSHAAVPHASSTRLGVTALSYAGRVSLALTGADAGELDAMAAAIPVALAELTKPG